VKVPWASASPLVAAVLWTAALAVDPGPLAPWSVLLVGLGLLSMSAISVIGMVLVGGRWARYTAFASVGAGLLVAVARPVDAIWLAALAASITAGGLLFLPRVTDRIRRLPSAAGPPPRAVAVPLILAATPYAIGLAAWDQPTTAPVVVGLTALATALWYSRVLPGGLYAVRLIWPLLAIGLAAFQPIAAAVVSVVTGVTVLALAWHHDVEVAFHPPRETGRVFPIPPELTPREILDAAELDEQGRPR
jgi:hypothetical protein